LRIGGKRQDDGARFAQTLLIAAMLFHRFENVDGAALQKFELTVAEGRGNVSGDGRRHVLTLMVVLHQ
jgi:hypothetical protein